MPMHSITGSTCNLLYIGSTPSVILYRWRHEQQFLLVLLLLCAFTAGVVHFLDLEAAPFTMRDLEEMEKEAKELELEMDMSCIANKSRNGSELFELLAKKYDRRNYKCSSDNYVRKMTLQDAKDDYLRVDSASGWEIILETVHPAKVSDTNRAAMEEEYFAELDKNWNAIRRTPALDASDRYDAPKLLQDMLRPFVSSGTQFNFSVTSPKAIHFDLGPSSAPLPPLSDKQVSVRLKRLMKRLQNAYSSIQKSIMGVVDIEMLKGFVEQMKENDRTIQSFEEVSFVSPSEPETVNDNESSTPRKKKVRNLEAPLFSVKQVRRVGEADETKMEWDKKAALIQSWSQGNFTDEVVCFSLPHCDKARSGKRIGLKEYQFWIDFLNDPLTSAHMDGKDRAELFRKLRSWPRKRPKRKGISESFWTSYIESQDKWENLLESGPERWTPRYPSLSKKVYAARLLSDKMLVYANSFREEVEDLVPSLLSVGHIRDMINRSHYCNPEAPSREFATLSGGDAGMNPIFSFVHKTEVYTKAAESGKFRRRKVSKSTTDNLSTAMTRDEEADGKGDGKSMRGRRKWGVGIGEKEIVENVGGLPQRGVPAKLSEDPIPVQSALQWAFNQSSNKFFFLKTDVVKLACDFHKLEAVLTCEREGKANSVTLPLNDCFRLDNAGSSDYILELLLLDEEAYHIVEEMKRSKLQLHTALKYDRPEQDILAILASNPASVAEKNFDGKLPLMVAIEKGEGNKVVGSILALSLPMDLDGKFKEFPGGSHCWIYVLTQTNDKYVDAVIYVLNTFVKDMNHIVSISSLTDEYGRKALDVATPKCRRAILSTMYFLGRYELKDGPPEHKSATCLVHLAIDRDDGDMPVALKLMKWKSQFNRELNSRKSCSFDSQYVLGVICSYDGDNSASFNEELERKGYGMYKYCIVMPAAERNLAGVMAHEHIAGKDWKKIRQTLEEMCECISHVHSKGMIHGDIKPLNIVRESGRIKLLDLDACVSYQNKDYCGAKYSSAYLPPEMVYCDADGVTALVKSYITDERTSVPINENSDKFDLVTATPSVDAWALGMTSFQLCTGEPFFLNNDEDNIDNQNLCVLGTFSAKLKREKMVKISNPQARNFVSLLLNPDIDKRLTLPRALQHPFLTGRDAARLPGDKAEFDVFLSYRVGADLNHAEMLYEMLTGRGLKVWWDKACLEAGVPWDEGFCHGLIKSFAFIPLLSRNAINHPNLSNQSFEKLRGDSRCDNVYLEHRLALELREMGLIEKIFPVMIGDITTSASADDDESDETEYSDYFVNGCHPAKASRMPVSSVEQALRGHLDNEGLGSPYHESETPHSVLSQITQNQGAFLRGKLTESLPQIVDTIENMIRQGGELLDERAEAEDSANSEVTKSNTSSTTGVGGAVAALKSRIEELTKENNELKSKLSEQSQRSRELVKALQLENNRLKESISDSTNVPSFSEILENFDQGIDVTPR